jgi:hypothetical protein
MKEPINMDTADTYPKLEQVIGIYLEGLNDYSEEQFHYKPNEDTWSIGQMYEHLLSSSYQLFFKKIDACLHQQYGSLEGEKNSDGVKMFSYGSFPPIKIKMPEAWQGPQPVAKPKDSYVAAMKQFLTDAYHKGEEVAGDTAGYKTKHVVLGMLTAAEWYQLLEMHYRHHLRQKKELEHLLSA